jgi:RNA polymerase sigma-70 factor, ECF subfamily
MTPASTQPAAPPEDPVRAALDDAEVRNGLLDHARAILGRWLADRPATARSEAVQETLLRALQKGHEYAPAVGTVRGWLHGVLNNVLRETARSLRRLPAQGPADSAAWERLAPDLAPQAAEGVLDRLAAADYLAQLPAEHRQVLQLRFYENLRSDEIAARLGISPANARVRLCRALAAVRAIAGADEGEDRR